MINIELKDGGVVQAESGARLIDIARGLSEGLARNALSASVDGTVRDLSYPVGRDCRVSFLTFEDEGGRLAYRHTPLRMSWRRPSKGCIRRRSLP
jgi:threonyl-tRNA synthetase